MDTPLPPSRQDPATEVLRRLERRLQRIEEKLGLVSLPDEAGADFADPVAHAPMAEPAPVAMPPAAVFDVDSDNLEFEVGQTWFAKIGIIVLLAGVVFLLSLSFSGYPAAAPSLLGYVLAGVSFLVAHIGRSSFDLAARYLRGAAMVLLFFATLRLFFFGTAHALETTSLVGRALLVLVVTVNLAIALWRRSPYLFGLSAAMGYIAAILIGTPWFLFTAATALSLLVVGVRIRNEWPAFGPLGVAMAAATYCLWAIGNPLLGHSPTIMKTPLASVAVLLAWIVIFAVCSLLRPDRSKEDPATEISAVLNAGLGYLLFLLHTLLAFQSAFISCHLAASVVFLTLAVVFWVRERSLFSTFIYAMTGYMALTVAIIKAFAIPDVFVWLSLQSLVVVSTAVWFRSRFIVVANFFIFLGIVAGYVAMAKQESGISLGFGLVALVTARILNWKRERLELRSEIMRNAYLISAFCVFPYALYHLVPQAWLVPAWVGMAVVYYLLNLVIRNPKYRWMGHGTLLLAVAYVVIIGIGKLDGVQRILSFLVLGTILLIVSVIFTRIRASRRRAEVRSNRRAEA